MACSFSPSCAFIVRPYEEAWQCWSIQLNQRQLMRPQSGDCSSWSSWRTSPASMCSASCRDILVPHLQNQRTFWVWIYQAWLLKSGNVPWVSSYTGEVQLVCRLTEPGLLPNSRSTHLRYVLRWHSAFLPTLKKFPLLRARQWRTNFWPVVRCWSYIFFITFWPWFRRVARVSNILNSACRAQRQLLHASWGKKKDK